MGMKTRIILINIVLVFAFFSAKASETFYKISQNDVSEVNKLYDSLSGENWYENDGWPVSFGSFSVDYLPDGIRLELGEVISSNTVSVVYLANITGIDLSENNLRGMIPVLEMEFLEKLDVSSNSFSFEHLEANAGGFEDYFYSPQDTTYKLEIIGNTATVLVSGQQLVYDWFVDGELKTGTNSPEYRIVPNEIIKCRVTSLLLPGLELWSEEFGEILHKKSTFQFSQQEVDQLNRLYYETDGENWLSKSGWPIKNEDIWYNRPTGLNLQFTINVLHSDEYTEVLEVYATSIDLSDNNLSGTITNLSLPELIALNLGQNNLYGEIPNFNLPFLQRLHLQLNELSGEIPNFDMPNLIYLELRENQLSGQIPNFNKLINLKELILEFNNLSDTIPNFNLPKLLTLDLYANFIEGEIPNFNLPNLRDLNLQNNQLNGLIPNFNSSLLRYISLSQNKLTGEIPDFDLPDLITLRLSYNYLNGNIPDFDLPTLRGLFLESNKYTFEELEVNLGKYTKYYYQNQDTILPITQTNEKIFIDVDGSANSYKWFLDSNEVQTTNVNYYTLTEDGVYYCEVRNSLLPGLTLSSGTISVVNTGIENVKDGDGNVRIIQSNEKLSVHSNGDYLGSEIRIFNNIGEIIYSGKMSNSDESVDISGFVAGGYNFVLIKNNQIIKSRKFVISR